MQLQVGWRIALSLSHLLLVLPRGRHIQDPRLQSHVLASRRSLRNTDRGSRGSRAFGAVAIVQAQGIATKDDELVLRKRKRHLASTAGATTGFSKEGKEARPFSLIVVVARGIWKQLQLSTVLGRLTLKLLHPTLLFVMLCPMRCR